MTNLSFIALVPMKGHSERIPQKNLRLFNGKPLCLWIIETLNRVPEVEKIVVNTDSSKIERVVQSNSDAVVHRRPTDICGDNVSMNRIIEYDIGLLKEHDHFIQTHSTNPLLSHETLRSAIGAYLENLHQNNSMFSVTRHQTRFFDVGGKPINHNPQDLLRTQDLPPLFEENSNFYIFSREGFTETGMRIGDRYKMFEMDPLEALDIDDENDWILAEHMKNISSFRST